MEKINDTQIILTKVPHNKGKKLFVPGSVGRGKRYTKQQRTNVINWLRKRYNAENKRFERGALSALRKEKGIPFLTATKWAIEDGMELPSVTCVKINMKKVNR